MPLSPVNVYLSLSHTNICISLPPEAGGGGRSASPAVPTRGSAGLGGAAAVSWALA